MAAVTVPACYHILFKEKWTKPATLLLFVVVWLTATYLTVSSFRCSKISTGDKVSDIKKKLKDAMHKLKSMTQLKSRLSRILVKDVPPNVKYESIRRRIYSNTKHLWYYLKQKLNRKQNKFNESIKSKRILQNDIKEMKRSLLSDQQQLPLLDGLTEWRRKEAASVSDLVQRRLTYLQNPPDCRTATKLVCQHDNCGFGCQLHHIVYCLIFAYATERTLILNSKGWRYNMRGWDHVFHPLSNTCNSTYDDEIREYPETQDAKVLSLPVLYFLNLDQKPKFLPLAIPEDLAHRIVQFNGDPVSWWIGQMIKYILKPRKHIQQAINEAIAKINFRSPIVGVHIRRSDKIDTEANFCELDEYMSEVDDYYEQLQLTQAIDERRVYIATDSPKILEEVRTKYPQFTIHGDASIAKSAATYRRYTPDSLTGLLVDLYMLASCDYLVCTFSSQFGRAAYEMMQSNRMDASTSVASLDDLYNFVGQIPQMRIVIEPGKGAEFHLGDAINAFRVRTGFTNKGDNKKWDMVPWYKTVEYLQLYPFPVYKQVPLRPNSTYNWTI